MVIIIDIQKESGTHHLKLDKYITICYYKELVGFFVYPSLLLTYGKRHEV